MTHHSQTLFKDIGLNGLVENLAARHCSGAHVTSSSSDARGLRPYLERLEMRQVSNEFAMDCKFVLRKSSRFFLSNGTDFFYKAGLNEVLIVSLARCLRGSLPGGAGPYDGRGLPLHGNQRLPVHAFAARGECIAARPSDLVPRRRQYKHFQHCLRACRPQKAKPTYTSKREAVG
jgi:hypothetical protein